MNDADVEAWVERLLKIGMATKLDKNHRALAVALEEKLADDPEQAAFLIAVLVQIGN